GRDPRARQVDRAPQLLHPDRGRARSRRPGALPLPAVSNDQELPRGRPADQARSTAPLLPPAGERAGGRHVRLHHRGASPLAGVLGDLLLPGRGGRALPPHDSPSPRPPCRGRGDRAGRPIAPALVEGLMSEPAQPRTVLILTATERVSGPLKGVFQYVAHLDPSRYRPLLGLVRGAVTSRTDAELEAAARQVPHVVLEQSGAFDWRLFGAARRVAREHGAALVQTHGYKTHLLGLS